MDRQRRLNLCAGSYPLDGFTNLDALTGWRMQDGLRDYPDGSVDAVTLSHALMYLPKGEWLALFAEVERVLAPGGVFRVTEDSTDDPESERFGGHPDAVTLTTAANVAAAMASAGLDARQVAPDETRYRDDSLIQTWHGPEPKVFHVESVKNGKRSAAAREPTAAPTLAIIIPTIGRDSLGRAIRSAEGADEVIVVPNQDGDRGYQARTKGIAQATTDLIGFCDDDDVLAPGAIGAMRQASLLVPTIYRMRYSHGHELWRDETVAFGNVGTPMIVVPNIPAKLGEWRAHHGSDTGGDYVFLSGCVEKMGDPVWRTEVVCLIRPQ